MNPRPRRRGYAMVAVVVFVMLFLGLWGLAARQLGSMLRIEQARASRVLADSIALPKMRVLAKAVAAIEVKFPPRQSYPCQVQDDVSGGSGTWFVVTFQLLTDPSIPQSQWTIKVGDPSDGIGPNPPRLDSSLFQTALPIIP
jgi:hypothetical protein